MPVTDVATNSDTLTLTLNAQFAAPVERLWSAFTDPEQLAQFWGPPGWPATFSSFDFTVGGHADYYMTGPRGEKAAASWEFLRIDEPREFEVLDTFANDDGTPSVDMPATRMVLTFSATPTGSALHCVSYFTSLDALEQLTAMGMVEGTTLALNQLDRVLQGLREYAQGKGTRTELLDDTHVRITRLIEGPRDLVWRAHTEPELMKRWLLGPDGWRMTECEFDTTPGGRYRYAWEHESNEEPPFGFDGDVLLVDAPRRAVTTEHMTGTDYASTVNDLSLIEEDGATLLTLVIEYADRDMRDAVLATGMTEGMEASYARLENLIATPA